MISFISGKLDMIFSDSVVIDNSGIGYHIIVSSSTATTLPKVGESVKLYTYMAVREDNISLYGFASVEEMQFFNILISVSGIGPKGALGMLAVLPPERLVNAVLSEDVVALSKAPGVGKKTAQRLILELRDKIKANYALGSVESTSITKNNTLEDDTKQDGVHALMALGYSQNESTKAISEVFRPEDSLQEVIKLALKWLR